MPRKCCVPECRGNYDQDTKISVFSFPVDPVKRSLWMNKIPRANFQPTKQSVVCASHFSEQFIVRWDSAIRPDGSVLTVERSKPKLTDDAYPTIFPNCPSYLSDEPPAKRRKPDERRAEAVHRDECAFKAYLEKDKITDFAQFSKELTKHTEGGKWLCRLQENTSSDADQPHEAYWSLYHIRDSNTVPKLVSAMKIFADMHVEVFTDRGNVGIVRVPDTSLRWLFPGGVPLILTTWSQFDSLLSHFSGTSDVQDLKTHEFDRMEPQDPVVNTEVKVEIDIAEELLPSWYMTERHPHVSGGKDVSTENTTSLPTGQMSESQTAPCDHNGVWPKQEVSTENTTSLPVEQTSESQTAPCDHNGVWPKQEVSTENTTSLPTGQMSESQVAPCSYSGVWPKQEVSILQMDAQTSHGCHSNICLKQEVTEDQHNMTDVTPGKVGTENFVYGCEEDPDAQGTVNTIHIEQDKKHSACMLECSVSTAGIQGRDEITGDEVTFISTQIMSCQQDIRPFGETLNYIKSKRTQPDIQPFATVQPTDNSTQMTTSGIHSLSERSDFTGSGSPNSCLRDLDKDVRNNVTGNAGKAKHHVCQHCDAKFSWPSHLKQHMLIHTGQRSHTCQHCGAGFSQFCNLKCHMSTHSRQKPHACKHCDAKFTRSGSLRRHKLVMHADKKPHACEHCDTKFAHSTYLKQHVKLVHIKQKHYACQICDAKFANLSYVKHHMLVHTGQKSHVCKHCDAKFAYTSTLKSHMLIHAEQKSYTCQQCDAKFTLSCSLKRHMLTHTGQKPFACQQCDAKFTRKNNLNRHMLKHKGQR